MTVFEPQTAAKTPGKRFARRAKRWAELQNRQDDVERQRLAYWSPTLFLNTNEHIMSSYLTDIGECYRIASLEPINFYSYHDTFFQLIPFHHLEDHG